MKRKKNAACFMVGGYGGLTEKHNPPMSLGGISASKQAEGAKMLMPLVADLTSVYSHTGVL